MATDLGVSLHVWKSTGVRPLDPAGRSPPGVSATCCWVAAAWDDDSDDDELSTGVTPLAPLLNLEDLRLLVIAHHLALLAGFGIVRAGLAKLALKCKSKRALLGCTVIQCCILTTD